MRAPRAEAFETAVKIWLVGPPPLMIVFFLVFLEFLGVSPSPALSIPLTEEKSVGSEVFVAAKTGSEIMPLGPRSNVLGGPLLFVVLTSS